MEELNLTQIRTISGGEIEKNAYTERLLYGTVAILLATTFCILGATIAQADY